MATATQAKRKGTHPLMPYHIVLTATVALLMLGLVIVTSASSVYSYQRTGSSYSIALKQALFGAIGCLGMWYAASTRPATIRRLAAPYFVGCIAGRFLWSSGGTPRAYCTDRHRRARRRGGPAPGLRRPADP